MASAQVLPNSAGSSRKKEHLEAGKRRLEEFRKKKAAAKKAALASQSHIPDSTAHEKQASEHRQSHINPDGATADGRSNEANTSGLISDNDKSHGFASDVDYKSVPSGYVNLQSHHVSSDFQQIEPKQEENNIPGMTPETSSDYSRQTDDQASNVGSTGEVRYSDAFAFSRSSASADGTANSHRPDIYGAAESLSSIGISSSDRFQSMNSTINDVAASVYAEAHATNLLRDQSDSVHPIVNIPAFSSEPGHGQLEELEKKDNSTSVLKERNNTNASGGLSSFYSHCSSISADFNSDVSSSNNGPSFSVLAQTHPRKSRTSFIDSLNISRNAPAADKSYSDKETSTASKFQGSNFFASSAMQNSLATSAPVEQLPKSASPPSDNYFGSTSREQKLFDGLNYKLESSSQKQNEDFAALEQHIEDLTREKFSLQRALETSKSLAESLAAENSSLTESYNQQASSVTQLKAEIERLRAEIKARLVELEAIKVEYRSAQLECNAADERAKLLASEVIGLEEKALRLRSNELKLERELENSNAEIASIKKKLSSLERERQDLLQTIDVLKEEKKLMQSKLQKASASEISGGIKQEHAKKEASTCTDDLGHDFDEAHRDSSILNNSNLPGEDDADNLLMLATHRSLGVEDSPTTIPPDQVQMIQNISSLICEIMAEKEELVQALLTERSTCTKLKDLNKELSQKLEAQTQRLELLTAQTMASENITAKQPTAPLITTGERETIAYTDEGDEVVERVLGWIMKLFPGGPTKRKTTRL